jgi:hypothetical protein
VVTQSVSVYVKIDLIDTILYCQLVHKNDLPKCIMSVSPISVYNLWVSSLYFISGYKLFLVLVE